MKQYVEKNPELGPVTHDISGVVVHNSTALYAEMEQRTFDGWKEEWALVNSIKRRPVDDTLKIWLMFLLTKDTTCEDIPKLVRTIVREYILSSDVSFRTVMKTHVISKLLLPGVMEARQGKVYVCLESMDALVMRNRTFLPAAVYARRPRLCVPFHRSLECGVETLYDISEFQALFFEGVNPVLCRKCGSCVA